MMECLRANYFFLKHSHSMSSISLLRNYRLPVPHHYIHNAVIRNLLGLHVASVAMSISSLCQTVLISERLQIKKRPHVVVIYNCRFHSQVVYLENSPTKENSSFACILFYFEKMCNGVMGGC